MRPFCETPGKGPYALLRANAKDFEQGGDGKLQGFYLSQAQTRPGQQHRKSSPCAASSAGLERAVGCTLRVLSSMPKQGGTHHAKLRNGP